MIAVKRIAPMALLYIESVEYLEVQQMQETHENEIKILNEIDRLATQYSMDKSKLTEVETKIEKYLVHLKTHFSSEEELMHRYNYPNYEMHKLAHDMFIADLEITLKQWHLHNNIDKVIHFIRKSPEWIILHINTMDAPTSAYITQKMKIKQ